MGRKVFLSCVSSQFSGQRQQLKQALAANGIELRIQEDFERSASPVGTLGKIYRFIKDCDLVVQLIGATQSHKVRMAVAQEVLDLDPNFEAWLAQRAILPALKAETLGYTDFEAYLALYLGKAFLPVRFQTGTQPEHEAQLRELGRHVEITITKLDLLLPQVVAALEISGTLDRRGQRSAASWHVFWLTVGTVVFIAFATVASYVLQLSATAGNAIYDVPFWVDQSAKFVVVFLGYFGLHLAVMGNLLVFPFRLIASLRNGSAMLLMFSAFGWVLARMDEFVSITGSTWPKLISTAFLLGIVGTFVEFTVAKKPLSTLLRPTTYAIMKSALLLWVMHWAGWSFDLLFWLSVVAGMLVLAKITHEDAEDLAREHEFGTSNLTPGTTQSSDGFFYYERHMIERARRVSDFKSKL